MLNFTIIDTPKSGGSFGDGAEGENAKATDEDLAAAATKAAMDERNKLPPYLPSIYGCRSVEEYVVSN